MKNMGGKTLAFNVWGKKKLAYSINKEKYGTCIFLQFKISDSGKLKELSSEFEHNPNILRYLNVKINEEDIFESKEEEKIKMPSNKDDDTKEDLNIVAKEMNQL